MAYNPPAASDTVSAGITKIIDSFAALATHHASASAPSSPSNGYLWYDTTNEQLKLRVGGAWVVVVPDVTVASGGLLALSGGTMEGDLDLGGNEITTVAAPTAEDSAARVTEIEALRFPVVVRLGTVSATTTFNVLCGFPASLVQAASLVVSTTVANHATDYWTFTLRNATEGGTPTLVSDTTVTTGLTADTTRSLGAISGTYQDIAANDVLQLVCTKSGAAANLVDLVLVLQLSKNIV